MTTSNYSVSQETKESILQSGMKCFAKNGFHGASLSKIAKDANVNKALISYHFENKETFYNAVFMQKILTIKEKLNRLDASDSLDKKVSLIASTLGGNKEFSSLLIQELSSCFANLSEQTKQEIQKILSLVTQGCHDPVFALGLLGSIHFLNIAECSMQNLNVAKKENASLAQNFAASLHTILTKEPNEK